MQKIICGYLLAIACFFNHSQVLAEEYCWQEKDGSWRYSSTPKLGSDIEQDKIHMENCIKKRTIDERIISHYKGDDLLPPPSDNLPNPNANLEASDNFAPTSNDPKITETVYNDQQKALEDRLKQEEQARKAQNAKYCEDMRTQLAQLRTVSRLTVTEPNGEVRRIDEEERKTKIANAEQSIADNCN